VNGAAVAAAVDERVRDILRHAARTAILPRFKQLADGDIVEKSPGELVTTADHDSEAAITSALLGLLPGSKVIGEEACAIEPARLGGLADGLVWIVDPLDGTANFAAGREPFGIIVALADAGETIGAWTFDPVADRLCSAVAGQGAIVSHAGQPKIGLHVPPPGGTCIASLATQFMPADLRETVTAAVSPHYELWPIPRCAVEHYWRLCAGDNHIAMFQRTLPWDHAAGALILAEAGGVVKRWDGSPYRFHDDGLGILAAASQALWDDAAERLLAPDQSTQRALQALPAKVN
jgi:fructose-1,6-bisphosphatase/inositol monophosphatase family enzyme